MTNYPGNEQITFSVFTPVYNRKDKIHRVWNSLNNQTYKNFEWIIVDDGSTDDILPLLYSVKEKAFFNVVILTQLNQGKHIAWNRAVDIAVGELFVGADSDDEFVPETLEIFAKYWSSIPLIDRNKYSGINVLCKDSVTGEIIGDKFPNSLFPSNNLELVYKYKIKGEKWGCVRTDLLRLRKNPNIPSDHCPETWLWFWLARRYNVLCVNDVLRIYYRSEGDSITDKSGPKIFQKRLPIFYIFYLWHLSENIDYLLKYDKVNKIFNNFIKLWISVFYLKKNKLLFLKDLKSFYSRCFAVLTLIPSWLYFYLYLAPKLK
jgi:glycosyltransferase involved in cell wall biosynthesis